jgi:SNF2 family DNA or RNA helicase
MLQPNQLHEYQVRAINHQVQHPSSMLWVGTGLGKTAITLTTIAHLRNHNTVKAALVLAPLRVCQAVWRQEAQKWEHLRHLRFSAIIGDKSARTRAITRPADVYLTNYENVTWLFQMLDHYYASRIDLLPFDMLVLDESTKMKRPDTKRMQAIMPYLKYFRYRTGLTGTPATNGLEDVWGQALCVDSGYRLGTDYSSFIANYFEKGGHGGYKCTPTEKGKDLIYSRLSDVVLQLRKEDYGKLPDVVERRVEVELPPKARKIYDDLEIKFWTELDSGKELEIASPAALVNKLLQVAGGNIYTSTELKTWEPVHDAKLEALDEIIEEAAGSPILVAYRFKPDAERIMAKYPYARMLTGLSEKDFNQTLEDWKAGKIRLLLGHPASVGHGVDGLQKGGHILVWFGRNWSLELKLQMTGRLERQGQEHPLMIHTIHAKDTADDLVEFNLAVNHQTQESLKDAVDLYRKQRGL